MKKKNIIYFLLISVLFVGSCKQDLVVPDAPAAPDAPPTPSKGSADFTKFVAVGNSFVAGMQGGALFTDGQNNSMAAIMNKQFVSVGASPTFNQPTIGAKLGYNLFVTQPFLTDNTKPILGRMLLQGASPKPTPQPYAPGNLEALPNPTFNPGFMYTGSKTALNNFSVPAITLGQALTPATGGPPPPAPNPAFTPFYFRFASSPSPNGSAGSSIMSDAKAAGGTFFLFWLGFDDFFLYAAFGGDPTKAPAPNPAAFTGQFNAALLLPGTHTGLLTTSTGTKVVVGNFPDIFKMPHFTSVPYNAIVFVAADQDTKITPTNAAYAAYNGGLTAAFNASLITASERDRRKISFAVGANGIVIEDETLTNLAGLGLPNIRQATSSDVFPLASGAVIGTQATPGDPRTTWGVSKALTDQYVLIPSEVIEINNARNSFNGTIATTVGANPTRMALADIQLALTNLTTAGAGIYNGVTITPNINPPTGIYSEDGVHPNSRGYAFLANVFIDAINTNFGAVIPKASIADYTATALPIP